MKLKNVIALLVLLAWSGVANATFHLWDLAEVYSNADGSVQFIELVTGANTQQFTGGEQITANSDGNVVAFTFPSNTGSPTGGHRLLIASPGFAGEEGAVTPDFTLPASFFDPDANSIVINFLGAAAFISFSSSDLPTDGVLSLNKNLSTSTNSPTNFDGETGQLTSQEPTLFSIGGNVSGLSGSGLALQNNNGDNLAIGADGGFTFATSLLDGSNYSVTVFMQPGSPSQTCSISNGSGTLDGDDVTNVAISCVTDTFSVGGIVSGLSGSGLVLQNNDGDSLAIGADGGFTFATSLLDGSNYSVAVFMQPGSPSQTCSISNGSGTLAGDDVTNVMVTCVTDTFTIGGSVSGLSGSGLVLQNNDGDNLAVGADGGFTFSTPLADGSTYTVTVFTQPGNPSQSCTVTNESGTLAGNNVANVVVTCVIDNFTIGGNVSGLSGSGLTLRNNGGNNLATNSNGPFTFSTPLENGETYSVTVLNQPTNPTQVCTVNNGSGTVSGANVTNISVSCVTNTFTIGGSVSGLSGSGLVLRNNGGNNLSIDNDGIFTFSIPLADGSAYLVTVFAQPVIPTQICNVANASGNLSGDDVTNVLISCNTRPVTVADSYSIDEDDTLNADDTDGLATSDLNDNGVLANDSEAENDTLTVVNTGPFTAGGLGGTIVLASNGTFSYTPPSDQSGVATHNFNVTDGVHIVPSSLSIDVQAVNDAPSFQNNGSVNFPQGGRGPIENAGWATSISAGPADESSQVLAFFTQVTSDPDGVLNSVSVEPDGDLQLDLTSEGGTASVEVTLMDDGGGDNQSPAVQFDVNVTRAADLVVDMDNGRNSLPGGGVAVYRLAVENLGPADVTGATVIANIPAPLVNATWTCLGTGGSSCPANGIGDVSESVDIPRGERVTFDITVDVPETPEQPVSFTAQAQMPGDTLEITPANNTDTDTDTIGLFGDSFESPPD